METIPVDYSTSEFADSGVREPQVALSLQPDVAPRLNVLLPHYSASMAYGGIVSALELTREISAGYDAVRFVSERPWRDTADPVELRDSIAHPENTRIETADLFGDPQGLPCHQREIFFCTLWSTALAWERYAASLRAAGLTPNPFYYFIQDYEPGFYAQNYKYCRALSTYEHGRHTHAIFNSRELAAYFRRQGFSFQRETVLAPSLHPYLRAHLEHMKFRLPTKPADRIAILLYGRPNHPRNCFPVLLEGLYRFFEPLPAAQRQRFMLLSAGASPAHPDIRIFPEVTLKCVGKLSMERYLSYLSFAHIGVSLMASPHPSYPPLEMASFGLYTITNRFANKDLSAAHPLLRSIEQPWPETLAQALNEATEWVEQERRTKGARKCVLPTNMSPLPWEENIAALKIETLAPGNG